MTPEQKIRQLEAELELTTELVSVTRELTEILERGDILKVGALMERYSNIETEIAKVRAGVSERLAPTHA